MLLPSRAGTGRLFLGDKLLKKRYLPPCSVPWAAFTQPIPPPRSCPPLPVPDYSSRRSVRAGRGRQGRAAGAERSAARSGDPPRRLLPVRDAGGGSGEGGGGGSDYGGVRVPGSDSTEGCGKGCPKIWVRGRGKGCRGLRVPGDVGTGGFKYRGGGEGC